MHDAGLRVCDIDFLCREIHVVQQANHFRGKPPTTRLKTRTNKRTVPLPADAHNAPSAFLTTVQRNRNDLVFRTKAGNPWCADGMGERFRAVAEKAQVPQGFTPHDLRHFYASALIRNGSSVKTVQVRLGHADAETTLRVYTHLWPDQDAHTRTAIETAFGRIHSDTPDGCTPGNDRVSDLRRDSGRLLSTETASDQDSFSERPMISFMISGGVSDSWTGAVCPSTCTNSIPTHPVDSRRIAMIPHLRRDPDGIRPIPVRGNLREWAPTYDALDRKVGFPYPGRPGNRQTASAVVAECQGPSLCAASDSTRIHKGRRTPARHPNVGVSHSDTPTIFGMRNRLATRSRNRYLDGSHLRFPSR
ncbi:tyrosine-type recombinase/integrase [Nocardia pseudobrasiliensis]|uniref:Phage integrase family protein n=1 Tax=Nocardia pseudobrasiliensis TaxID=45979 RepID=A0A370I3U5_9NOCA|nr:site-specific integrase [Nocardia pseudobrasiliensis]RDI64801.1 phage integrase family protein [Nocardia pseudobrasiliensis]